MPFKGASECWYTIGKAHKNSVHENLPHDTQHGYFSKHEILSVIHRRENGGSECEPPFQPQGTGSHNVPWSIHVHQVMDYIYNEIILKIHDVLELSRPLLYPSLIYPLGHTLCEFMLPRRI